MAKDLTKISNTPFTKWFRKEYNFINHERMRQGFTSAGFQNHEVKSVGENPEMPFLYHSTYSTISPCVESVDFLSSSTF